MPSAIQAGDAGEFATVMLSGGVPHPSGYPWMRALGLLARGLWALGLPPATAAALPPALCGVAGWLLIHRCCVLLGRPWVGAFAVSLAAASPLAVLHVNDSEVWGPHLMLAGAFLYVVIRTRSGPRPFLLGISLGLAVSHHLTAVLLVPLAIGAALPRERDLVGLLRNGALGLAGSLVGLLPFASLPLGGGGGWRWGQVQTFDGLLHHILRVDYGTLSLSLHEEEVAAADTVSRALASVAEVLSAGLLSSTGSSAGISAWIGAGALVLVLALAGLWVRDHRDELWSGVALGWALSVLASALAFPAAQNIDPTGPFGAWILERFDLLTILLLVVPLALALSWLGDRVAAVTDKPWLIRAGAGAIATVLILAQLGAVLERGRPAGERGVELAAIDVVASPDPAGPAIPSRGEIPVRAIVFGTEDHRSFPVLYVQEVLGAGSHTLYIDAQLLAHPWYRARLRARVPSLPDVDKPLKMMGMIWSDPELAAVPIYLANVFSRPAAELPRVPEGVLWRVPPPPEFPSYAAADWTFDKILERHLDACARMRVEAPDFAGLTHPRGHPWSADLWFAYVDKARQLAATLARAGRQDAIPAVGEALEQRTGAKL
ncbi:glycosyltransferase family 39 protein [Enhygromyxa salina]|uniref:glycosyltransferase family 39 protein n=1 Tax=Enhygromyxa salina TaxID=215803 RepID=UPI0015E625ED|nr:glycosyltransferase family 39 protein [Enhygromyxa salina]